MPRISRKNRTHLIAISTISLVIIVIFVLMQPKHVPQQQQQQLMGDRYIQIYSATWGEACNKYIDDAIANPPPPKRDSKGKLVEVKLPTRVAADNVLDAVSNACNGKLNCSIQASSAALGVEPLATCYKDLIVSYRCFTLDRLWPTKTRQGDILNIDCKEKTPEPAADAAAPDSPAQPQQ